MSTTVPVGGMSAIDVLTTTRSVRRRLDLDREVDLDVVRRCIELALQAPTGSNSQLWHFVAVTDPRTRAALADLYREAFERYKVSPFSAAKVYDGVDEARRATQRRVYDSAEHLVHHLHEVPVHVIPCIAGRTDDPTVVVQASFWGSIHPATWSFMLAARAHGLASSYTTLHLMFEEQAAEILGIPFDDVTQAGLVPVAHPLGGLSFRPAPREHVDAVIHHDGW